MKKKLSKILGVGITLVMVLSLTAAFSVPVMAAEEEWDLFSVPDVGADGDYFMDTTITGLGPFAMAIDGTLYLYMDNSDAADDDLYKSEDEGRTWSVTDYATDTSATTITDIACSSEDADILYVADATNVYKTEDAGGAWTDLGAVADTNSSLTGITCLAVGYSDEEPHIFVGGDVTTTLGEVFYYRDSPFYRVWTDLDVCAPDALPTAVAVGELNVWGIATSPDFDSDTLVVAVTDNTTCSFVVANVGAGVGTEYWDDLELENYLSNDFPITGATNPVFVEDFDIDDDYEFLVGVSGAAHASSDGGVYRITGTAETDDFLLSDVDDDIASLDLVGDLGGVSLLAGTDGTVGVTAPASIWYSTDDGDSWDETEKAPSGLGTAQNLVIVADDFADSGEAWCAADATTEGGVHITTDFGATWNGISMLGTNMAGAVNDIAFTADYGTGDAPMFMVTKASTNTESVWKYDGDNWERVWLDDTNELTLVEVSPAYAEDTAVFIAASAAPTILYSHDGGATFDEMVRQPGDTAAITSWLVIDDETVITGAAAGVIYKTARYGRRAWDEPTMPSAAIDSITDLAVSPNYAADGTILAGDADSQVFISFDEGEEFEEVSASDIAGLVTGVNDTYVCFDARYADNNMIYAASDDVVARVEIDTGEDMGDLEFDNLSGTGVDTAADLVTGAAAGAGGIVCSDDGMQAGEDVATLYVNDAATANVTDSTVANIDGGVWRCLNPADSLSSVIFEQAIAGLADAVDFSPVVGAVRNLEMTSGSNVLYVIDSAGTDPDSIYTYEDTLAAPVVLSAPADGEALEDTTRVEFEWDDLNADTVNVYQIQVNDEEDFPSATDESVGNTTQDGTAATVATTEYTDDNGLVWRGADDGTVYYWRVRVGQQAFDTDAWAGGPLLSRWSVVQSCMTKVLAVTAPVDVKPLPGAQDIILTPTFAWKAVSGAELYDIEVATDPDFESLVTAGTPTINTWAIDIELDYATIYYWKVRGISADGAPAGKWIISAFTTMTEPAEEAAPVEVVEVTPATPEITVTLPTPSTPAYVWAIIGIGALLVIALIILIVRTRRVV